MAKADIEIPNFGELLGKFLGSVSRAGTPGFLAGLEREAAARYRAWAAAIPAESEGLLACAAREDEIADRIDRHLPLPAEDRSEVEKMLPEARSLYFKVFDELSLREQLTIQANAERQGAQAWRGLASQTEDSETREELLACATLEEVTADHLDRLLDDPSIRLANQS